MVPSRPVVWSVGVEPDLGIFQQARDGLVNSTPVIPLMSMAMRICEASPSFDSVLVGLLTHCIQIRHTCLPGHQQEMVVWDLFFDKLPAESSSFALEQYTVHLHPASR